MNGLPPGYTLVPTALLSPARPRSRRSFLLVALMAVALWTTFNAPSIVSADTIGGNSTGGCVQQAVIFSGVTTNVASHSIAFRARVAGSIGATVVVSHWWSLPDGSTGPLHYFQGQSFNGNPVDQIHWLPGQYNVDQYGFRVRYNPGTTGLARHVVVVTAYNGTGCVTIDEIKVERTWHPGGATPPPGGGGYVAPTPTPVPPTIPPTPTQIPGGVPDGSNVCFQEHALSIPKCYPPPPTGWCYEPQTNADPILRECETRPTPTPPPDPYSCTTILTYYDWCFAGGPVGGQFGNTGTIGTVTGWDGSDILAVGGWVTIVHTGAGAASAWSINANGGCSFTGAGWATENYNVNRTAPSGAIGTYHVNLDGTTGTRKTTTTENWSVNGAASRNWTGVCTNSSTNQSVPLKINKTGGTGAITWQWVIFGDFGNAPGATAPPPTPTPTPTRPPTYGSIPPPEANTDGQAVDICSMHPNITACAQSFPPGYVDICDANPGISACATAPPTFGPPQSPGFGDGPIGSPVPNGLTDCVPNGSPKPGTLPLVTFAPFGLEGVVDGHPLEWPLRVVGDMVGKGVVAGQNVATGVWNTGVDAVVPSNCLGEMVTDFGDTLDTKQPFSAFFDAKEALEAAPGSGVTIPVVTIGSAEVDIGPAFATVGDALEPFGAILRLIPWLIGTLIILRKLSGTFGAGEGGG